MVTQVLVTAVQNSVERRELGVATATTGFFRAFGGAVGAAVLGAVFAAHTGVGAGALRADVIDGVQTVFVVARRQLARWTWGYGIVVSLLLVIAWDMVFKPGL